MLIYILMFFLSLLSLYIAKKTKKKRMISFIFESIGILLPCFLAGSRNVKIGSDTSGYVQRMFELTKKINNFNEYFNVCNDYCQIDDFLYIFENYFICRIFNNFSVLLFVNELLVVFPVYLSIKKIDSDNVVYGMFIFYMFFYNISLCIARQAIAISFCILSLAFFNKKDKINIVKSVVCFVLACGFHKTAIIFLTILILFCPNLSNVKFRQLIEVILVLSLIYIVIDFKTIIVFLNNTGIYKHGYAYLKYFSKFDFSYYDTFLYTAILSFTIIGKKQIKIANLDYNMYNFLAVISLISLQFGINIQFGERVSYYFVYPLIFNAFPILISSKNSKEKNEKIDSYLIILLFIVHWVFYYRVLNLFNTMPYIFK